VCYLDSRGRKSIILENMDATSKWWEGVEEIRETRGELHLQQYLKGK